MEPPHDNGESDTKPSVSSEIARVAFKPPPLWRNNVELWFSQIESQFLISGISQEETKFHHVVVILKEDILSYVSDLVRCRPNDNPYTQLKNRLITQLADSESVRLRNLLSDMQLSDKKPSQLLHEMQDLSLGKIKKSVTRMLWCQRLPITTQQILSASTDKLASLALTADKIAEVSGVRTCVNSVEVESTRLNRLEAQISELISAVQQVQSNNIRFRNASPHRRYRTRFSSRNRSFCWYHSKFGKKAQKCVPPCDFSENKPFDLRNAAQTFQRFLDDILRDLNCFAYLDDILIASIDHASHYRDLEQVFQRLNEKGLVLNIEKCIFGADKLPFLGCEVSKDGISPSKEKVEALVNYPQPQDVSALRRFLAMLNFYRRFIPNAAEIQRILYDLVKDKKKRDKTTIDWSEAAVQAFQTCKNSIAQAALLAHRNSEAKLLLVVDASNTESRYSTYDRELFAVYSSVKHFRHFLEGRDFIIYTNHKPLTFAFQKTGDKTSPRQQRHLEFISQFGTDIRCISGIQNTVADALSRIDEISIPSEIDYEEIARAQTDDEELLTLQGANSNLVFKTISLEPHGTPLHCDVSTGNIRPYVPKAFRTTIINGIHSLAHS
ncbi:Retrovirus-related Pol polyprotein from transposon 297 [Araneus ventricosus]|uniref:RNA-directed DNA polymerase n=1 Tax=Araneus ventricosus TaxID=182803 RepID=A0A4Y2K8A4_ARAVE|nr:Retrovirus-related Pol polyprotein from transposon 297 [Araneus ventricosus]